RYACAVGVVFGAALLIKPTMCVMTVGLWGLSFGVGFLCDWYIYRPTWKRLGARYGIAVLATVLVAGPYFLWNGKDIASYIHRNIFGKDAALWHTAGTAEE